MLNLKYNVIKRLGSGGNSSVSLIQNRIYPHKEFACKIIPKILDPKKYSQKKINSHYDNVHKEIEIMKSLMKYPNIIKYEESIEDDMFYYIIMEICKGGDIKQFLSSNDPNTLEECVRNIVKECLNIVAICHENDIIHNDIKPENLLFKELNNIKTMRLIDFGTSINTRKENDSVMVEMTPWYVSPESLSSKTCKKSDVWSVGVMTYYLLTGKFPFNDYKNPLNPSVCKIWNSILNDSLDFRNKYWCNKSTDAQDFVNYVLKKDFNARPTVYEALSHKWMTKQY